MLLGAHKLIILKCSNVDISKVKINSSTCAPSSDHNQWIIAIIINNAKYCFSKTVFLSAEELIFYLVLLVNYCWAPSWVACEYRGVWHTDIIICKIHFSINWSIIMFWSIKDLKIHFPSLNYKISLNRSYTLKKISNKMLNNSCFCYK